jgi:glycosyltransferase involved in cell wall biosynthesis
LQNTQITFITIGPEGYSRSWNYFKGLQDLITNVQVIHLNPKNLLGQILKIRKKQSKQSIYIIMSPSQYLTPLVWGLLSKKIILDAGWSLYEGTKISRGIRGIQSVKSYLIDFIASQLAQRIILESNAQIDFYQKKFKIKKSKCVLIYTGVNEKNFLANINFQLPTNIFNNSKIVLFRGKYNQEGGLEVLAKTTKVLESHNITFWVFTPGMPEELEFSKNTIIDRNYYPPSTIARIQSASSITLGQLAKHERLNRTIPHKAFEAAFLGKAYLTGRNHGILEIFKEDKEISCFNPGDSTDLANKILELFKEPGLLKNLGLNMQVKYNEVASQTRLANKLLTTIKETFE